MNAIRAWLTAFVFAVSSLSMPTAATSWSTDQSDLWWNASESGWGIQFVQRGSAIFATMFVYGSSGNPTWYTATMEWLGNYNWSGDLYLTNGPWFGTVPFNPAGVTARKVGTMTWSGVYIDSGALFYSVDGVAVNKALVRQLTRYDDYNGAFLGAIHQQVVGCLNQALNGTVEQTGPITIVQNNPNISVIAGGCVISGSFSQAGQFGSINGTYTCSSGDTGTARTFEMIVGLNYVSARFDTVSSNTAGCQSSGYLAGVRHKG